MTALDASVLIAWQFSSDEHHRAAQAILSAEPELVVHPINLTEALVAPLRAQRGPEAEDAWHAIGIREWGVGRSWVSDLARVRVETRLKLPDCCALLAAEQSDRRLATFDRRLARVARERGIEVLDGGH